MPVQTLSATPYSPTVLTGTPYFMSTGLYPGFRPGPAIYPGRGTNLGQTTYGPTTLTATVY